MLLILYYYMLKDTTKYGKRWRKNEKKIITIDEENAMAVSL